MIHAETCLVARALPALTPEHVGCVHQGNEKYTDEWGLGLNGGLLCKGSILNGGSTLVEEMTGAGLATLAVSDRILYLETIDM